MTSKDAKHLNVIYKDLVLIHGCDPRNTDMVKLHDIIQRLVVETTFHDSEGNAVDVGDLLISVNSGVGMNEGEVDDSYSHKIWEFPEGFENQGVQYGSDYNGMRPVVVRWFYLENSVRIKKEDMPKGFMKAFKNGLTDIITPSEYIGNIKELLITSDWDKDKELFRDQTINDKDKVKITPKTEKR